MIEELEDNQTIPSMDSRDTKFEVTKPENPQKIAIQLPTQPPRVESYSSFQQQLTQQQQEQPIPMQSDSPRGKGHLAENYEVGSVLFGTDGKKWIVYRDRNTRKKYWHKFGKKKRPMDTVETRYKISPPSMQEAKAEGFESLWWDGYQAGLEDIKSNIDFKIINERGIWFWNGGKWWGTKDRRVKQKNQAFDGVDGSYSPF